ncbi:MAG: hypothetical protein M1479_08595 [Actinobacteria bacterium]|nr:hypothetical protein [Actinomycetota bacterium]
MTKDFMFSDIKNRIKQQFINNGWVTIYKNLDSVGMIDNGAIYCALVNNSNINNILDKYNWDLLIGHGRPGFEFYYKNNEERAEYKKFFEDGIEPFIYYRCEFGTKPSYLELSEEFRLYYNLFEEYIDIFNKNYIYIDSNGDEEVVVQIKPGEVIIKLRFIKNYISVRDMCLVVFFEMMRFSEKTVSELNIQKKNKTIKGGYYIYNHLIRDISSMHIRNDKIQSWIMGKVIIKGLDNYKPSHEDEMDENYNKYTNFNIGYDENGNIKTCTCDENKLSNYFGKNPKAPHYLTPVYFSCEVLNKYYDNPQKYTVEDGCIYCKGTWSLRVDNSCRNYVVVFLGDLGKLNYKEQLYWKSYNINPEKGMSSTGFKRAFLGMFTDPNNPDLYFKMRFKQFNEKWKNKFGWILFKTLSKEDEHYFSTFHLLTSENNDKEFDGQILAITKIIIDSLNEKELQKSIENLEKDEKGIDKFEKFLITRNLNSPDMIQFLRNLQSLRSTTVAHRRSIKNKKALEILKYFDIGKKSLKDVLEDIIVRVIWIFNTLENRLL